MHKVILQLKLDDADPSVERVRSKLGLKPGQIDSDFGVRRVRKGQNVFAVRVDADAAGRLRSGGAAGTKRTLEDTRVALIH